MRTELRVELRGSGGELLDERVQFRGGRGWGSRSGRGLRLGESDDGGGGFGGDSCARRCGPRRRRGRAAPSPRRRRLRRDELLLRVLLRGDDLLPLREVELLRLLLRLLLLGKLRLGAKLPLRRLHLARHHDRGLDRVHATLLLLVLLLLLLLLLRQLLLLLLLRQLELRGKDVLHVHPAQGAAHPAHHRLLLLLLLLLHLLLLHLLHLHLQRRHRVVQAPGWCCVQ